MKQLSGDNRTFSNKNRELKIIIFQAPYFYLCQVQQLRQRFSNSIAPGGLAGDRRGVVPASGFLFSSQQIWKVIRENKDLDLPAHKVHLYLLLCTKDLYWVSIITLTIKDLKSIILSVHFRIQLNILCRIHQWIPTFWTKRLMPHHLMYAKIVSFKCIVETFVVNSDQ